jgi:hypothetical protein
LLPLIIAGVSQRFVPLVYGLKPPKKDRQRLIFARMNGALILNVISYVAVLTTGNLTWGIGLELAYLLMPLWAVLLAIQLGVFSECTGRNLTKAGVVLINGDGVALELQAAGK